MSHALLAPSSAHRWVNCPGSVFMESRHPDTETQAALEGTAAHWAMAEMLNGRIVAEGQITDGGTILTTEMIESAEVIVRDVQTLLQGQQLSMFAVEKSVSMAARIHAENWGTPDVRAYAPATRTLWVWDLKHGHEFVPEYENWQLIDYAAGAITELGIDGHMDQVTNVILTVVQPRNYDAAGPVRRWVVKASDLRGYFNRLQMAAEDATSGVAGTRAGSWCVHCKARGDCQTLQRDAWRSADLAGAATPVEMPLAAVGLELGMLQDARQRLEQRILGLQTQVEASLRSGKPVEGWSIEQGYGREKYTVPDEQVITVAKMCGIDASKAGVVTPNQLRAAGMPKEFVDTIARKPLGEMRLVRGTSAKTRKVFDGFVK